MRTYIIVSECCEVEVETGDRGETICPNCCEYCEGVKDYEAAKEERALWMLEDERQSGY